MFTWKTLLPASAELLVPKAEFSVLVPNPGRAGTVMQQLGAGGFQAGGRYAQLAEVSTSCSLKSTMQVPREGLWLEHGSPLEFQAQSTRICALSSWLPSE